MEIKWIKLDVGLFDNRKIKQIRTLPEGDSIIIIWLQLICLAGITNDGGKIYLTDEIPYTDQMLSTAFNEPLATVQLALATFEKFGMIDVVDEIIYLRNWEKYQAVDGMEKIREQAKLRMRNYRERQKQIESDVTVTQQLPDVTQQNKNKKENKNKNKNKNIYFIPPTIDEVRSYFAVKGCPDAEAERFYDYYTSNGWKVGGKGKMKDWEAAARNWMRNDKTWNHASRPRVPDMLNNSGGKPIEPTISAEEAEKWMEEILKETENGNI